MTPLAPSAQPTKILFAPKQDAGVTEIAKSLTPPGFELIMADFGTPEFVNAATEAEYFLGLARNMGGEFFRSAPKLKLVQLLSAGYDRVDVEAARKAKVPVSNNGGANAIAVAEHTILLMLAVLKQLVRFHLDVVAGKWRPPASSESPVLELAGRTVGIVGLGNIGKKGRAARPASTRACSTTTSCGSRRPRRTRWACASCCWPSCSAPPTS